MSRRWSIGLGVCLAVAVSAAAPRPDWWVRAERPADVLPCLPAPERGLLLDGELDEWADLPALPLGLAHQTGFDLDWLGRGDLSAAIKVVADDAALYLAFTVADDKFIEQPGRPAGDHVRIVYGESPTDPRAAILYTIQPPSRSGDQRVADVWEPDAERLAPGALAVWTRLNQGYRLEVRLPLADLPGGPLTEGQRRGLAVAVVDWDDAKGEKARLTWPADLRAPEPLEAEPPAGYQSPRREPFERPTRLGELRRVPPFRLEEAADYLPALLPLGVERSHYAGYETARIEAMSGLGLSLVARAEVVALDPAGKFEPVEPGAVWSQGAVEGMAWFWRAPPTLTSGRLLALLVDHPGLDEQPVFARLESVGEAYDQYVRGLAELRAEMLAAAVAPDSDARRRRYIGAVLINLENAEQGGSASYRNRSDLRRLADDVTRLRGQFAEALRGVDPYRAERGVFLRGYVSDLDDTVQHYSVAIPEKWQPNQRLPLVISLHGYGFGRFHGHPAPSFDDKIGVACYGRGNGDYKLWCENDILTVVEAMLEDYHVDPYRVYITGGSMGGTGSWHMATMYPDRFAAIGPQAANSNHHVWEELWGWGQLEPTFLTPFRNWLESTTSAFQFVENLRQVGVYALHGAKDDICPVGHARTTAERLRNLGYDAVYEEFENVGHGGFPGAAADRQKKAMFARARDPWPRHVTYKTAWHRYPGAYWVMIERFERQATDALIDVRVVGQKVLVECSNVARFALTMSEELVDTSRPIEVTVNGQTAYADHVPGRGVLRLGRRDEGWGWVDEPRGLSKNPRVGGPVEHAFMSRFLLVCGTAGDQRTNLVNKLMCEQLAEKWRRWGRDQRARVKQDWEVTERDIAESNLICFGGPDSNRFVRRINDQLPIRFENGTIVAGTERFRGPDVGVKMVYPNPLNPDRYVGVFGGLGWQGTWDINGRFGNWFDWGVFDDRNWFDFAVFDAHTQSPETFLLVGYFDEDWQLSDEAFIIRGDPELRRQTRPRQPPDPLAGLPAADVVYLSQLTPLKVNMEKGVLGYDQSFAGQAIRLGDLTFERGLGIHPQAEIEYDLDKQFETFEAWVGIDLAGASSVSAAREQAEKVAFQVHGDGKLLADTGEMRWYSAPRRIVCRVSGVRRLKLTAKALDGRKWLFGDAAWGLARLTRPATGYLGPPALPVGADRLTLDGRWLVADRPIGEGVAAGAPLHMPDAPGALALDLPGSLPAALEAAGELPPLYRDDNLGRVDALARREWWLYRRTDIPAAWQGRRVWLELTGVTQAGDVWLNGQSVGSVTGPFAVGRFELTRHLRWGEPNLLALRVLAGPAEWTNVRNPKIPGIEEIATFGVGYEGHRAIPLGVAVAPVLRATGRVTLTPLRATFELPPTAVTGAVATVPATLLLTTRLDCHERRDEKILVKGVVEALDGGEPKVEFERRLTARGAESVPLQVRVELPRVRLWWPAGQGEQPRYRVRFQVSTEDLVTDAETLLVGARRFELQTGPAGPVATVNGQPLTLRVVGWQPLDRLLRRSAATCEDRLRRAREAGFNAVRVTASAGLETPFFYDACDRLGLLVIQDLPLPGELTRLPETDLLAAVDGVVEATRNRAAVVAYALGAPGHGQLASERRAEVLRRLTELAGDRPQVTITGGPERETWAWSTAVGRFSRQVVEQPVVRVELPPAPPGALDFLDRARLPEEQRAAPWPTTDLWRFHGGRATDLDTLANQLGPLGEEAATLALLALRHQQAARRVGLAVAAGEAIHVPSLHDSWPAIAGGLIDHAGQERPGLETIRRLFRRPALVCQPSRETAAPGETIDFDVYALPGPGAPWWDRSGPLPRSVQVTLVGPDGRTVREATFNPAETPVFGLSWPIPPGTPAGFYQLVAEAAECPADRAFVAVHAAAGPPVARAVWLAAEPPPTGLEDVGRAALTAAAPVDLIYLGPGDLPPLDEAETAGLRRLVASGSGLLVDGPPVWCGRGLADLLPAWPLPTPLDWAPEARRPERLEVDHPILQAVVDEWPAGRPPAYHELAPEARTLVGYDLRRPLLVEGRHGRGRVLLAVTPALYRPVLTAWAPWPRLRLALLAYTAGLPHAATRQLLASAPTEPLPALTSLPANKLEIRLTDAPLAPAPGRPDQRELRLRHAGNTPIPLLQLRLTGLPEGVSATFFPGALSLQPGEERTIRLTVIATRRPVKGRVKLELDGLGVAPQSLELALDAGD